MIALDKKYNPSRLRDFIGLHEVRAILEQFIADPYPSAWFFLGPSGLGKTAMSEVVADAIGAERHDIPSKRCDLETLDHIVDVCHYVPFGGGMHAVCIHEADKISNASQLSLLSRLDGTAPVPDTIWLFTANETELLEDRFLSRCRVLKFKPESVMKALPRYLRSIWLKETGLKRVPDFAEIVQESNGNVRQALMLLEMKIAARKARVELSAIDGGFNRKPKVPISETHSEAAKKAWVTIRRNRGEEVA